ncbi:Hsp33 family molecular chaperone HslO [Uliginosibacterium sp. H3]|uniref:Hsp33 family molecular chaperone HslO n=1 Tax=Uliginosibacterium silvisoli TaxID=3114758 RepID=A0ABU6K8N6_9RHOO|nr:Hsp33 family molecular chaperone HslO [Uliginosibacterium sp. H3]
MNDSVSSQDFIQRFLLDELDIHGAHVRLTESWQRMRARRNYPRAVTQCVGEMAAVTVLIGERMKEAGKLSFQLRGNGKVPMIVVDCTDQLNVRGYASVEGDIGAEDGLHALLGDGRLVMTLDLAGSNQPFQSFVPIEGNSLAAVFEHYIAQSEQQAACLILSANETSASGLLLQKLPGADARDLDGWSRVMQLAQTLRDDELQTLDTETLLTRLFHEETVRIFEPRPVTHHFPPDPDKVRAMLKNLGREEVERIIAEQGKIVVDDDLSNNRYEFSAEEGLALFAEEARIPPTLH